MDKYSNEPAFPVQDASKWQAHGMTLRDFFAAATLAGPAVFDESGYTRSPKEIAEVAYSVADAMMAARDLDA